MFIQRQLQKNLANLKDETIPIFSFNSAVTFHTTFPGR